VVYEKDSFRQEYNLVFGCRIRYRACRRYDVRHLSWKTQPSLRKYAGAAISTANEFMKDLCLRIRLSLSTNSRRVGLSPHRKMHFPSRAVE
uniref:Uncharacterized protein n=1 Tax=Glossina palpalis gambiensis TaxID=67801 RepID=A0A1B0BLI2_9MUSC